jgi:hypothetical protein
MLPIAVYCTGLAPLQGVLGFMGGIRWCRVAHACPVNLDVSGILARFYAGEIMVDRVVDIEIDRTSDLQIP